MKKEPIVIVGAGPSGSLLGIELARRGADVRILEKAPAPPVESRAGGVQSRSLELFARLGFVDELLSIGNRVRAFNYYSELKPIFRVDFGSIEGPFPFMLQVPQYETQRVLDACLIRLGVPVERGVEVVGLAQDEGGVAIEARTGSTTTEQICASYVAGCDGAHSAVRHQLGMPFQGQGYDWDWIGADVEIDWSFPESEVHLFLSDTGVLACLPFGSGRWRLFTPKVEGAADRQSLDDVRELVASRGPAGISIDNPTWLGTFRASRRSAPHYRQGRVFLAGDAVHIHSPAAGQGMNTGLGDAANLGWKLAHVALGRAPESLLDTYEPERAPVARGVIALTHTIMKVFDSTTPAKPLRDRALPLIQQSPAVQRALARRLGQHSISYRGGPLAGVPGSGRRRIAAGDRAPDVTGLLVNGESISLFRLLGSPDHALFAPSEAKARDLAIAAGFAFGLKTFRVVEGTEPDSPDVVVDVQGALRKRYDLRSGEILIIRPDGYVGYLGKPEGLPGYLSRCLLAGAQPVVRQEDSYAGLEVGAGR